MAEKVLCKYYMHGCCKNGDSCGFSHNFKDAPNMVCKFYLSGNCVYGNKCRYDHHKPDWIKGENDSKMTNIDPVKPVPQEKQQQKQHQHQHQHQRAQSYSSQYSAAGCSWSGGGGGGTSYLTHSHSYPYTHLQQYPVAYQNGYANTQPGVIPAPIVPYTIYPPAMMPAAGYAYYPSYYYPYHQPVSTPGASYAYPNRKYTNAMHENGHHQQPGQVEEKSKEVEGEQEGQEEQECEERSEMPLQYCKDMDPNEEFNLWKKPEPVRNGRIQSPPQYLCYEYMTTGNCINGNYCPMIHGCYCEICGKYCLYPENKVQQEQHMKECKIKKEKFEKQAKSAELECAICLEKVYSKQNLADRRFGLMDCEHVFCIRCIRNWRANEDGTADVETAVRTCPMCRKTTHFITPSAYWPESSEEKKEILASYKERLGKIDCRHFNFGDGQCPFGTSCFYRHVYKDGTKEEKVVRRATNADGQVTTLAPMKLVAILESATSKRASGRRRRT